MMETCKINCFDFTLNRMFAPQECVQEKAKQRQRQCFHQTLEDSWSGPTPQIPETKQDKQTLVLLVSWTLETSELEL